MLDATEPLHPWQEWDHIAGVGLVPYGSGKGIDILDWMATQLMPVFLADAHSSTWASDSAELAYKAADALLAERAKRDAARATDQTTG